MSEPVAVQLRSGPIHLAFAVTDAKLVSVCGGRFGLASVVPVKRWTARRARRCEECEGAATSARSSRVLRIIAGV